MKIEITDSKFGYVYGVKIDGEPLNVGDKVLLLYENEVVTIDKLMTDHAYIKFSDGWMGTRKYGEFKLEKSK